MFEKIKNLGRQLCADEFNSGVEGLKNKISIPALVWYVICNVSTESDRIILLTSVLLYDAADGTMRDFELNIPTRFAYLVFH
jgi:hypothetical protein